MNTVLSYISLETYPFLTRIICVQIYCVLFIDYFLFEVLCHVI